MTIGVIRWDASDPARMGRGGLATTAAATALVAMGWLRLQSGSPPSTPLLIGFCAAGGMVIVALCYVTVPARIRMALSLALLVVMLASIGRGDPMGAKQGGRKIGATVDAVTAASARAVAGRSTVARSGGARIALVSSALGDGGWAHRLDSQLDGQVGGAQAAGYTLDGEVSVIGAAVRLDWGIGAAGARTACGATTGSGDPAMLEATLAAPLRQAVARSVQTGRAACP